MSPPSLHYTHLTPPPLATHNLPSTPKKEKRKKRSNPQFPQTTTANSDPQQTQTHTRDSKPRPIPVNPPLHHPLQPLPPRLHHHQSPHHHHTINTPPPHHQHTTTKPTETNQSESKPTQSRPTWSPLLDQNPWTMPISVADQNSRTTLISTARRSWPTRSTTTPHSAKTTPPNHHLNPLYQTHDHARKMNHAWEGWDWECSRERERERKRGIYIYRGE